MTFWIGETMLGVAGLALTGVIGFWLVRRFASTSPAFNNTNNGKKIF